jgi:hypothetical protein
MGQENARRKGLRHMETGRLNRRKSAVKSKREVQYTHYSRLSIFCMTCYSDLRVIIHYDQVPPEERQKRLLFFIRNSDILESAKDPLAAIRVYLEQVKQPEEGKETTGTPEA